jgi:MFS family permease
LQNKKAIAITLAANSVSSISQGIVIISVPWYYTSVIDKPSDFGIVYLIVTCLSLFWGLYAGTLIDKHDRRNIFRNISIAGAILMGTIAFSGFQMGEIAPLLVAVAFGMTLMVFNIHYPNLYAFAQEISDAKDYSRIASYLEVIGQFTTALAGAAATLLLTGSEGGKIVLLGFAIPSPIDFEPWQLQEIFLLDAITYSLAAVLISFIKYTPISERHPEPGTMFDRLRSGMRYLKEHYLIFIFGNASYSIFVTILVLGFFLAPIYVSQHLNMEAYVYTTSEIYFAFGSIMAGAFISRLFAKVPNVLAIIITSATAAMVYFYAATNNSAAVFYMAMAILGFCNAGTRVLRVTWIFNRVENQVIGRTSSVFQFVNVILRAGFIALFSTAFFMEGNNVVFAMMILGFFAMTSAFVLLFNYGKLTR